VANQSTRSIHQKGIAFMFRIPIILLATMSTMYLGTAFGQGLITQKAISYEMAQTIVQGTIQECRTRKFVVSVTVLDGSGLVKAFARDDGINGPHTIDLSKRKAYTALTLASRFPTSGAAAKAWNSTLGSPMPNIEGTAGVAGGVPIMLNGVAIGAVGVSGAVGGDNDEACANAGIAKVASLLK
jgi:Uncharacterized protein, possibly involved in utilization of glycolate and propanediol